MKTGTKRVLSLLLAVVLTFSLGAAALAVDTVPADSLWLSGTGITADGNSYKLEMYVGNSTQVTAGYSPSDYNQGVSYKSSDQSKVTVDVTGKITAVAATAENTPVTVTVSAVSNDPEAPITKTISVTVKANGVKSVTISGGGITSGSSLLMKKGTSTELTATTEYLNGGKENGKVNWSSSNGAVVNYTSTGTISAKTSGTATITATSTDDNTKKASLTVNVYEVTGLTLKADPSNATKLIAEPSFASGYTCTDADKTAILKGVTWTSSNTAVATVENGVIIPVTGAIGTTTITATLDGKTATYNYVAAGVKINEAPATGAFELGLGTSYKFTATYAPSDATVKWTKSETTSFSITQNADNSVSVTTTSAAKANDTMTLTVTATKDSDIKTAQMTIKAVGTVTATKIELAKAASTLYVGKTETIGYTLTPTNASYTSIKYSSSDPTVATVSDKGLVTALKAGTTQIKAVLTQADGETKIESGVCTVTVKANAFTKDWTASTSTSSRVTMSSVASNMLAYFETCGGTGTPNITLTLPTGTTYGTLYLSNITTSSNVVKSGTAYSMSDFKAMTLVTTATPGTYSYTYTLTDGTVTVTGKVSITIKARTADVTVTLTSSSDYVFSSDANKEKTSAYSAIRSAVYSVAGEYPNYIKFGTASGTSYGTLYDDDGDTVSKNIYYSMTELKSFTFDPAKKGTYSIAFTAYSSRSSSADITTGTLEIVVTTSSSSDTVTVTLDDGKSTYSFSDKTDEERVSAYTAIREYVYDIDGSYPKYIEFGRASNTGVGTMYDDDGDTYSRSIRYSISDLADFTFKPASKGTYTVPFTAYSTSSTSYELATGTLEIVVPSGSSSRAITVTLDGSDEYSFSDKTKADEVSAYTAIKNAIKNYSGETYSYLKFDSVDTASSKVGTLYANDDEDTLSVNTKYYYSSSKSATVYDLFFVPKASSGTYERTFTAYNDDNEDLGTFTLEIVVGKGSSKSSGDIYANVAVSNTVTLGESMFTEWYQDQTGSGYKLAYVTFDDVDSNNGTFKHSSTSFDPDGDIKFYTDSYTGSTGSSAKYLKNVKYTASKYTGTIAVDFTCYGGTTTSKYNVEKEGTLYILVTDGDVKAVTYSVKTSAVTLSEKDFLNVYKTAMDTTSSSTKFYIELLGVPSKGTLYYNYSSASKPGTKLTSSNYDDYALYVNGSSSNYSVADITYVPATSATGAVSVDYIAYSTSGTPLYVGTLTLNYGAAAKTVTCYSDGYTFKATDFYSSADADPIKTVAFAQPAYGKLFMNYNNGYGTAVTANNSFYTAGSVKNASAISTVTYVPKAGFNGSVSVNYSAVTESGVVVNGTMTITVKTKTASSTFTDVTASGVGSWAADSIDYAKAWGLVNGTGTTTFSPNATMTRAMLVTVLYRAAGSPAVSGTCKFTDVAKGQYYYNAVIWGTSNGIVTGVSSTSFNPNGSVTREQVAALLYRFAQYKGISTANSGSLSAYTDKGSVSSYATNAMTWAVAKGYITSTSTTAKVLSPASSATRAQVCVMLHRFLTDF